VVAALAALLLGWVALMMAAFSWLGAEPLGKLPRVLMMPSGTGQAVFHVVLIAVLAPIGEELFFRGWLWTALRRSWGPAATLICTSLPWLLMHFADGTWRALVLVPAAILLGLARHYGGSVRASLILHLVNNGTAIGLQIVTPLFGAD